MSGADVEADLREEAEVLAGNVWRKAGRCGPDCGIASGLATRAADEIAALRARLAEAQAQLAAARTLPDHDVALVAALREEGWPECIAAADRIETLVICTQALLAEYLAQLKAARTVTPEMVEAALVAWFGDPEWATGAHAEFVARERRDMRAALEAARAAAQEAKP